MAEHETITDIIAEKRRQADKIEREMFGVGLVADIRREADRLEAALKRELSKNTSKNGADFGQLGDAAKLREAIKNSNGLLEELATIGEWGESAREQIAENNAALAAAGQKEGGTK